MDSFQVRNIKDKKLTFTYTLGEIWAATNHMIHPTVNGRRIYLGPGDENVVIETTMPGVTMNGGVKVGNTCLATLAPGGTKHQHLPPETRGLLWVSTQQPAEVNAQETVTVSIIT